MMLLEKTGSFLHRKITRERFFLFMERIIGAKLFCSRKHQVGLLVLILILFLNQSIPYYYTPDTDAPSFYTAAHGILNGVDIYDQNEFQGHADSLFGKSSIVFPYLYLPVMAQVFVPLTLLDYPLYSQVLLALNILLTILCFALIAILLDLKSEKSLFPFFLLLLPALLSRPVQITLQQGQINILVFFLILLSLLLFEKKPFLSSLALCLAISFKIYPVLFIFAYLYQKKYRYIAYTLANGIWIFCLSLLLFSHRPWIHFLEMALGNFIYGKKTEFFFDLSAHWGNVSLNGFITQLFLHFDWPRSFVMPAALLLIAVFFVLSGARMRTVFRSGDSILQASIVLILALLFSSISWNHHFVIILLPVFAFTGRFIKEGRYGYLPPVLGLSALIFFPALTGGFPHNQVILTATIIFLILMLYYNPAKGSNGTGRQTLQMNSESK